MNYIFDYFSREIDVVVPAKNIYIYKPVIKFKFLIKSNQESKVLNPKALKVKYKLVTNNS